MNNIEEIFDDDEFAKAESALDMGKPLLLVESDSLSRILIFQSENAFIIMTAYNIGLSEKENKTRNAKLLLNIRQQSLKCRKLQGVWKAADDNGDMEIEQTEQFFYIPFDSDSTIKSDVDLLSWAVKAAHIFRQDAIIYGNGDDIFLIDIRNDGINSEKIGTQLNISNFAIEKALSDYSGKSRFNGRDFIFEYHSIDIPDSWMLNMAMAVYGVHTLR
jgi:hypothetical protein